MKKIKLNVKKKNPKIQVLLSFFLNDVKSLLAEARMLIEEPAFEECLKDLLALLVH